MFLQLDIFNDAKKIWPMNDIDKFKKFQFEIMFFGIVPYHD